MFLLMRLTCVAALLPLVSNSIHGQEYPSKPVRIISGSAGGSTDFTARQVAKSLSGSLGQQVVVDNQTQVMQTEIVIKAAPDGYTLLITGGSLWIFPLMRKTPYDPIKDFAPITLIEQSVNAVVVHPSLPVKSIPELIALAKAKPGELNYATAGTGSTPHLAGELFKSMANVNIVHIPYKGNAPALIDLVGGQVQLAFPSLPSVMPHIKSGRLKALAVTSVAPSALFPGLPTVAATVPGYESVGITAFFAPAKTPAAIIRRLNDETVRFLRTQDAKESFLKNGAETVGSSPEQLAAANKAEMERFGKLIKDIGLRLD